MSVEVKVPSMPESITEVFVGDWLVSEGDFVEADAQLVELESEKATQPAIAPSAGVVKEILVKRGDAVGVGDLLAVLDEKAKPSKKRVSRRKKKEAKQQAEPTAEDSSEPAADANGASRVMPAAQRLIEENNLDAEQIPATGPGGRLLKEDVLQYLETQQSSQPQASSLASTSPQGNRAEDRIPMSPIRRTIARRLVEAQQTAALLTTFNEVNMAPVMEMRKTYKEAFTTRYGIKLGFMSFFIKASIDGLKQFPAINAEIQGDDVVYRNFYDVGIAVGGGKGLVVPVLRNAESLSFAETELAISDFAKRAQSNELSMEELTGGTFTITNGGVYGSLLSTPIVNPPQSGVLGMHGIQDRPVAENGQVVIRPMMYIALTYDHRIVDGREAVSFLKRIKEAIEDPARMLLEI